MPSLEIEKDGGRILAAYLELSDKKIARSVEIEHGKLVVDEAEDGSVVGVEFILPVALRVEIMKVSDRYKDPAIKESLRDLF
ncbi:MAG: DUF2283 domain-containing protein [Candidatus Hydrogenedentota bacterium]